MHASIVILKQSATKNTALTRAPSTSARAHPNVFLDHFFGDICKFFPFKFIFRNDNNNHNNVVRGSGRGKLIEEMKVRIRLDGTFVINLLHWSAGKSP